MDAINFLKGENPTFLYLFLLFSSWLENIFPPIPGDTITAIGAFFVATGRLSFIGAVVVTTLGSVTGFLTLFLLGRYLGRDYFLRKNFRYFSRDMILKAEERYKSQGYLVVLLNRFLPGVRSVISLSAGIIGLRLAYVIPLSTISALLWNLIWIYAGYLLGTNWETVKAGILRLIRNYNIFAGIVLLLLLLGYLLWRWRKKR
ncbi:MAG: DedA family protein [Desulfatiglandales bacterium]